MNNEDIIIGIDFGTTNSAACIYKDEKFQIIPSAMGYDYFPSVVAVNENGELLVGHHAKKQMASNASNSVAEFKLKMGENETIKFNGEDKLPQEITSYVLGRIKRDAEAYLGKPINKAVISVPASFDNDARNATMEAGEIAGFEVEALVDEPTAACLTYSLTKNFLGNILVFDMGGGTLDIIIGAFDGSELVPKVTTGARFGGRNITMALRDYLQRDFEEQNGLKLEDYITPEYDPLIDLYNATEIAKIELSSTKTTNVHIDSIVMTDKGQRINLDKNVNRSDLNKLSDEVVKGSKEKVLEALKDAKLTKDDIDFLVFVGGPTKMPLIRESIEKLLGKSAAEGIDPMVCVAQGASIYKGGPITVGTINSLTLSVVINEKESDPLIPKNTPLPAEVTKEYHTMRDNQTSANIQIVEGESILAKENHTLHSFTLRGLPPRPKGEVAIQVKLKVDKNGIMGLSAKELSTNKKLSATFDSSNRMSSEEIKKAGLDNENLLSDYEEKIKQRNIINDAEEVIFEGKKLIENYSGHMLISDKNRVNENIEKLEGLLVIPKNFELIKLITKDLRNLIEKIESEDFYY
ncbi:Hsp70 family protein [Methanobrevibacter ruminantium]|uniref:Hsp70 family protein n=1 Tax=Methanobrevibacter ruminantium TaxID=83816 RepID=UPI000662157D|nr:Hsp70 family protein [Methanobrevibacter ruminantium]